MPHAYLAQLDARVVFVDEVLDQLTEIDAGGRGEVEDHLDPFVEHFHVHQLHVQLAGGDAGAAESEGPFRKLGVFLRDPCLFLSGAAGFRHERGRDAAFFVGRGAVARGDDLLHAFVPGALPDDDPAVQPLLGFDHRLVAHGQRSVAGVADAGEHLPVMAETQADCLLHRMRTSHARARDDVGRALRHSFK